MRSSGRSAASGWSTRVSRRARGAQTLRWAGWDVSCCWGLVSVWCVCVWWAAAGGDAPGRGLRTAAGMSGGRGTCRRAWTVLKSRAVTAVRTLPTPSSCLPQWLRRWSCAPRGGGQVIGAQTQTVSADSAGLLPPPEDTEADTNAQRQIGEQTRTARCGRQRRRGSHWMHLVQHGVRVSGSDLLPCDAVPPEVLRHLDRHALGHCRAGLTAGHRGADGRRRAGADRPISKGEAEGDGAHGPCSCHGACNGPCCCRAVHDEYEHLLYSDL